MSRETSEFLPLSDAALRAVSGPNSRHTALLEDAFSVLIETPGGGVSLAGDAKARAVAAHVSQRTMLTDQLRGIWGSDVECFEVLDAPGVSGRHEVPG